MANSNRENAELQRQWDLEEEIRVNKRLKIALIIGVVAVYSVMGFVVWLALSLKGITG